MSGNKKHISPWALALLLSGMTFSLPAQKGSSLPDAAAKAGPYAWIVYAGGGFSYYTSAAGIVPDIHAHVHRVHPVGSLRIMWQPDHLLSVGVESGLTVFYSYHILDSIKGKVTEKAVPLLLVFSIPVFKQVHLYAGPGVYFIQSLLDYNGTVRTYAFSLGWMAAVSYEHPISQRIGIAAEIKGINAFNTLDESLTLQIQLKWKIFSW